MPRRKTSSEKKSAATRFLWMAWRLVRSLRKRHSRMKVIRRRNRDTETVVYVTIFRGRTSPCCGEQFQDSELVISNNH